jgi:hypothetical protein
MVYGIGGDGVGSIGKNPKTVMLDYDSWQKLKVASVKSSIGVGELLRYHLGLQTEENLIEEGHKAFDASLKDPTYWKQ